MTQTNMQIGKQGLTDNFIKELKKRSEKYKDIKINVLTSAGHEKSNVKQISKRVVSILGKKYTARIIGFTIFVKKWRKEKG